MGRAWSTHGRDEKCIQNFGLKPEGKQPLRWSRHRWDDNIRMDLQEIGQKNVDWIHLAEEKDQWQALVNMVINLWVHRRWGISWLAELLASQGLYYMDLVSYHIHLTKLITSRSFLNVLSVIKISFAIK